MLNKQKNTVTPPPLVLRERVLEKYYNDLKIMDHVDAYIAYDAAMHRLYVKHNPWLARNKYGKPRRMKTRRDFGSSEQDFNQ